MKSYQKFRKGIQMYGIAQKSALNRIYVRFKGILRNFSSRVILKIFFDVTALKRNFTGYTLLIFFIIILCALWNFSIVQFLREIDLLITITDYPLFVLSPYLNILILIFLSLFIFSNRCKYLNYSKRFTKSLKVFGSLQHHYALLIFASIITSSLIIHQELYQRMFFFNGDYVIIIVVIAIFLLPIQQNQKIQCPKISKSNYDESPIESFEEDRLNMIDLVEKISTYLISRENGQKAVSVELRGKWGSGKTSLINLLDLYLKTQISQGKIPAFKRFRSININVSKFEKVNLLYLHFFYEVIRKLEEEYLLPRIDANMILSDLFEKLAKGINISALQNRILKLPKIENYLNKISCWLCLSNLTIICYLDDVDRLDTKQTQGILKLIRLVKYNMKNIVLISSADFETYVRCYNDFVGKTKK